MQLSPFYQELLQRKANFNEEAARKMTECTEALILLAKRQTEEFLAEKEQRA